MVAECDRAAPGERSALLGTEGLYHSRIIEWRKARDAGPPRDRAGGGHAGWRGTFVDRATAAALGQHGAGRAGADAAAERDAGQGQGPGRQLDLASWHS